MDLIINPTSEVKGIVEAPPSKSYTHRYLFLALLSNGTTKILNPLISGDTEATIEAVISLGADGDWTQIVSQGWPKIRKKTINCRRSGTTCRFTTALATLPNEFVLIDGDSQLRRRPMKDLIIALENLGIKIASKDYKLPIKILGGKISRDYIDIRGDKSSQYISALILLGTKIGLSINVIGEPVSREYIDLTIKCIMEAGGRIKRDEYNYFEVEESDFKGGVLRVPGDYSSAAFLMAAGALGGYIEIKGLIKNDIQPDRRFIKILERAGAEVAWKRDALRVNRGRIEGFEVDLRDSPDLLPITTIIASFANGKTIIKGIEHTRYKESDRVASMKYNLMRMGIKVEDMEDKLIIYGGKPSAGIFKSFNDHRVAMAMAVAALFLNKTSMVTNIDIIRDSYPNFIRDLNTIGGKVVEI